MASAYLTSSKSSTTVWTKNSSYYSRRPEPERIALLLSMINEAGRPSCDGTFPVSLIYALIASPALAVPSTLCRFPLVVFQQTSQSFSTPHGSNPCPQTLGVGANRHIVLKSLLKFRPSSKGVQNRETPEPVEMVLVSHQPSPN